MPEWIGSALFLTAVGLTDRETEVLTLIGSKEGTAHIPFAFVNPGDVVLVPDPGYPVYAAGTWFAGGEVHYLPLRAERDFLPDLDAVPADVARRAKMLFLNYPNNPTAGVATSHPSSAIPTPAPTVVAHPSRTPGSCVTSS